MMSSLERSHHIYPGSLPFSPLAPPDHQNSAISTTLQSHHVEVFWTGISGTGLLYCGTLCQPNVAVLKIVARRGRDKYLIQIYSYVKTRGLSLSQVLFWLIKICIRLYFIKVQPILLGKSMATRLTSLQRLSNSFTNNGLDFIGYLLRLLFLLYCMTLIYLYARRLIKHYYCY